MTPDQLHVRYPWLTVTTTVEDYVAPAYYDRLLKDYRFSSRTDLERFQTWLDQTTLPENGRVLELGCGTGRATKLALQTWGNFRSFQLVDLSPQMLQSSQERFSGAYPDLTYTLSDSLYWLEQTTQSYDAVFSLWSFSHSVHQVLTRMGLEEGVPHCKRILSQFLCNHLMPGGVFFLIHFDSCSDEQRILIQQWKKVYPIFANNTVQSPSKLLIDEVLRELEQEGIIRFTQSHLIGDEIVYASEDEALEIFLNFHMESYFNDSELLPEVIDELRTYFQPYTDATGTIRIKPGCFLTTLQRC